MDGKRTETKNRHPFILIACAFLLLSACSSLTEITRPSSQDIVHTLATPTLEILSLQNASALPSWKTTTNPYYQISFQYPAHWVLLEGDPGNGEKFGGEDGYVTLTAVGDVGLTLDQAIQAEVGHKLQPYGPDPIVEEYRVQGQEAGLILPSDFEEDDLRWQAALLVTFPRPVSLAIGGVQHEYPILALYADPAHIHPIAGSLRFDHGLDNGNPAGVTIPGDQNCFTFSEIEYDVCWPSVYSLQKIEEDNRRGSFAAYGYHLEGHSQTPYLSEIQFFDAESIKRFMAACGKDTPCFFSDYPDSERYAGLKAAFSLPAPYHDYALKRFDDRDFFVVNLPCYGDECILREYATFFGDVLVTTWIVMESENQCALGDQLFQQVSFSQSPSIETLTPYPVCTPPACAPDETYHCPDECPGGCGTTCATATPGISRGTGQVWGAICPLGGINPEMSLYFQEIRTQTTLELSIGENQASFQFELPAGVYVAYTLLPDKETGGSYSHYVRCNSSVAACTDHNLVPFLVQDNHVTTGVNICDWSGDPRMMLPTPGEGP